MHCDPGRRQRDCVIQGAFAVPGSPHAPEWTCGSAAGRLHKALTPRAQH